MMQSIRRSRPNAHRKCSASSVISSVANVLLFSSAVFFVFSTKYPLGSHYNHYEGEEHEGSLSEQQPQATEASTTEEPLLARAKDVAEDQVPETDILDHAALEAVEAPTGEEESEIAEALVAVDEATSSNTVPIITPTAAPAVATDPEKADTDQLAVAPPPATDPCKPVRSGQMHHKDKIQFFEEHPECKYMNACDGELPPDNQTAVKHLHTTYVFRYTDDIRYSHMAMIDRLPDRKLVAAWQAAPDAGNNTGLKLGVEGLDEQHLLVAISQDQDGKRWTMPQKVPLHNKGSLWSPVLFVDGTGRLWFFYSESVGCRRARLCKPCPFPPCPTNPDSELCHMEPNLWVPGGDIKVTTSVGKVSDNVWRPARTILPHSSDGGIPKVISNRVTVLSSGEWLLPFWREQTRLSIPDGECARDEETEVSTCMFGEMDENSSCMTGAEEAAGVIISADQGNSWRAHGMVMSRQTSLIEGSVVELKNKTLFMVFRTTTGCLYSATSPDKGVSWDEPTAMAIPNPNSKVHLIKLEPRGELLLAFNNHRPPGGYRGLKGCKACRTKLHLALSVNNGNSWRHIYSEDDELSAAAVRVHYPCIMQIGRGPKVALAYSRFYLGRKKGLDSLDQGIRFSMVDLTKELPRQRKLQALLDQEAAEAAKAASEQTAQGVLNSIHSLTGS